MVLRPLIQALPASLVKFFAKPYVAGDSLEQGLQVTRRLHAERKILTTFDLLQENVTEEAQVAEGREVYRKMVDACAAIPDEARPSLSFKPSSYTLHPLDRGEGMDAAGSEEAVREIVSRAKEKSVLVTCDMEDRHWTDWTLELCRALIAEGNLHLGTVLQTRLHRTEKDLDSLPSELRIRLVIGIYKEPAEVATLDNREMKERMLRFARVLLERGHYVEFATHDEACVRRFLEDVVPAAGVDSSRYEVQMLYGVPRVKFQDELVAGRIGAAGPVKTRLYVPFATSWKHAIAYCRRRLLENPSMASAVGRNLIRGLLGKR